MARYTAFALGLCMLATIGCASYPGAPSLGLQRSLYPGLGDLDQNGIEAALSKKLDLTPPLSAGLVWLSEAGPGSPEARVHSPIAEYGRTGVLDRARERLVERTLRSSVAAAAKDLLAQVSGRFASR